MSQPVSHLCPNCGAPLAQHSFVETCPYCGYVSEVYDENKGTETDKIELSPKERYSYITRHLSYIQSECPVDVVRRGSTIEIRAKGAFSPNDGKKTIKEIILRYNATIAEDAFNLHLLIESRLDYTPIFYIKTDSSVFIPAVVFENGHFAIAVSTTLLCVLCEADNIDIDTNLILMPLIWKELKTYSRRFFHSIINRQRYLYSIHQRLIIDKD